MTQLLISLGITPLLCSLIFLHGSLYLHSNSTYRKASETSYNSYEPTISFQHWDNSFNTKISQLTIHTLNKSFVTKSPNAPPANSHLNDRNLHTTPSSQAPQSSYSLMHRRGRSRSREKPTLSSFPCPRPPLLWEKCPRAVLVLRLTGRQHLNGGQTCDLGSQAM